MKSWLKLVFQTLKVFILFTGCTILFYYGMMWFNKEYDNNQRFEKPEGSAIKASSSLFEDSTNWLDRLRLFYINGE